MAKGDRPKTKQFLVVVSNEHNELVPKGNASLTSSGKQWDTTINSMGQALFVKIPVEIANSGLYVTSEGYIPFNQAINIQDFPQGYNVVLKETVVPVPIPPDVEPQGVVRTNGYVFLDDKGPYLSFGVSHFCAPWMYMNEKDRLGQNISFGADVFTHARILGEVGSDNSNDSWYDRRYRYTDIDWDGLIHFYLSFGQRLQLTIFGGLSYSDTAAKRKTAVQFFIDLYKKYPNAFHSFEVANESWKNGPGFSEAKDLMNMIRSQIPVLPVSISSPDGMETQQFAPYISSNENLFTYHVDRDDKNGSEPWRWLKQFWDVALNISFANDSNEPKGPGSSLASDMDPLRLVMSAATTFISGGYVFHSRPGVRFGGQADMAYGPWKNIFDLPNINLIMAGFDYVKKLLPSAMSNWTRINGHWGQHPLTTDHFWQDGFDNGVIRNYCALSLNQFFSFPFGIKNYSDMTAKQKMRVKVHDVLQRKVVATHDKMPNEAFRLNGTGDAQAAYILEGELL